MNLLSYFLIFYMLNVISLILILIYLGGKNDKE